MALFEFNRSFGPVAGVGRLSFERAPGLICALDGEGKLVMSIATGPGIGQRLAEAFSDHRKAMQEADRQGAVRLATSGE
ncbi:hypothetical protein [Roseateles sp. P5_D6]